MYCPRCTDEFRDDIDRCPDCGVELTPEPGWPRGRRAGHDVDPDVPVELFWTADPRFLVNAASQLTSASIPFDTEGAELLNPKLRRRAKAVEPMAARLLVPARHHDAARELLDEADLDPAASALPEPVEPKKRRRRRRAKKAREKPTTLIGWVGYGLARVVDLVFDAVYLVFQLLLGLAGLA